MTGWIIFGDLLWLAGGYIASIYTWPWLRTKLMGAKTEIERLEARIKAIADAAKPK